MMYKHEGVIYAQYCQYRELYYQPYEIYGDELNKTDEAMGRLAHPSELWFLCDSASFFQDHPMLRFELEYDQCVIEMNQQLAYQGVLDTFAYRSTIQQEKEQN